jgi:hypothetical protein
LIDLATAHQPPFRVAKRRTRDNQKWKSIFSRRLLRAEDYQDASLDALAARIREQWMGFTDRDLLSLVAPIQEAAPSIAALVTETESENVDSSRSTDRFIDGRRISPSRSEAK